MNFTVDCGDYQLQAVLHLPAERDAGMVLLICHGFRGSMEGGGRAVALAERVTQMGFSVVRFNFTPLQKLSKQIEEVEAMARYCRQHFEKEILLLGRSMGGSAALVYAATASNISGLCLWATPLDLTETFKNALGTGYQVLESGKTLSITDAAGTLHLAPDFIEDFNKYDLAHCLRCLNQIPVLLLHGSQDEIVKINQAQKAYQVLKQPKELAIIAGGDHQLHEKSEETFEILKKWLKRHFI